MASKLFKKKKKIIRPHHHHVSLRAIYLANKTGPDDAVVNGLIEEQDELQTPPRRFLLGNEDHVLTMSPAIHLTRLAGAFVIDANLQEFRWYHHHSRATTCRPDHRWLQWLKHCEHRVGLANFY